MFTRDTVTLPANSLNWAAVTIIEHSTTRLIPNAGSDELFVTGLISCVSNDDFVQVNTDAEKLAKVLKEVDSKSSHLLPCHGLVTRESDSPMEPSSIELVFRLPFTGAYPTSLRQMLLQHPRASLNSVFRIAQNLASAVSSLYNFGFTHKNIRPETILLFPTGKGTPELGAFLLGVDILQSGDTAWERNLYRHPTRQGLYVNDKHVMQHDIYSMGVSLLELGLWKSFIQYSSEGTTPLKLTLGDLVISESDLDSPTKVKDHLITIARSKLPFIVAPTYAAVVNTCLTCLDMDNVFALEEDMSDEDPILLGMGYFQAVLDPLLKLSV
jgi:serine/threonine protein kinase